MTRPPAVYRVNPFQIEVGMAYGGGLPIEELIELYRLANRVPLQMSKGALPTGPMVLMVHIASVWVPFTSESKEAIAPPPGDREGAAPGADGGRAPPRRANPPPAAGRRRGEEEVLHRQVIPHIGIALKEILTLSEKEESQITTVLRNILERSRKKKLPLCREAA